MRQQQRVEAGAMTARGEEPSALTYKSGGGSESPHHAGASSGARACIAVNMPGV
ncbi:MAG TPA: hypothetical protein VIA62_08715 [Thermoanaerobaculia bacterium]|jgi:hypothetical protein|nr:hypothetical protein [Thermoanaerobaculia bacterium]